MNQRRIRIHLINPSHVSFGIGVITPRWLYVLAQAAPARFGDPVITDQTLESLDSAIIARGDIVGIGIHTGNILRGYEIGTEARAAGAIVVFGRIHATLFPEEARDLGAAHAVVKGDGDLIWTRVLDDCAAGRCAPIYEGGQVEPDQLLPARWDLMPPDRYMWASCADRAWPPEALFVLFRLEDRWPAPASADERHRCRRDRRVEAPRVPFHCAGRRQFLSGDADGPADRVAPGRSAAIPHVKRHSHRAFRVHAPPGCVA